MNPTGQVLIATVPLCLFILVWDNQSGNRQDDLAFAWACLALSAFPLLFVVLFFVNRFRQRPRGRRVFPPRQPLGEPRWNRGRFEGADLTGVRYALRASDIRSGNAAQLFGATLLALVGLALVGAGGKDQSRPGAGSAQWYGAFMLVVALLWAVVAIAFWLRGFGLPGFVVVVTAHGVWLPLGLERDPLRWEDVVELRRSSLQLRYRARPDWNDNGSLFQGGWRNVECAVDVLELLRDGGLSPVWLPLDELPDAERFVRQLSALWRDHGLRAALDDPGVVQRLQDL